MYLLANIGGTKTKIALVENEKEIKSKSFVFPTSDIDNLFSKVKSDLLFVDDIDCVVCGVAGVLDKKKEKLMYAPNLKGWKEVNLKKKFEKEFGCEVFFENDSALEALGESVYGAGRGFEILAYLSFGTGIGGARVVSGKIDKNRFGFEPGHHIVDFTSFKQDILKNDFESFAGGRGVKKRFNAYLKDVKSKKEISKIVNYMAIGSFNALLFWSPDVLVVGGGNLSFFSAQDRLKYKKTVESLIKKVFISFPKIKFANLGDLAGLYGAFVFAKQSEI